MLCRLSYTGMKGWAVTAFRPVAASLSRLGARPSHAMAAANLVELAGLVVPRGAWLSPDAPGLPIAAAPKWWVLLGSNQ